MCGMEGCKGRQQQVEVRITGTPPPPYTPFRAARGSLKSARCRFPHASPSHCLQGPDKVDELAPYLRNFRAIDAALGRARESRLLPASLLRHPVLAPLPCPHPSLPSSTLLVVAARTPPSRRDAIAAKLAAANALLAEAAALGCEFAPVVSAEEATLRHDEAAAAAVEEATRRERAAAAAAVEEVTRREKAAAAAAFALQVPEATRGVKCPCYCTRLSLSPHSCAGRA